MAYARILASVLLMATLAACEMTTEEVRASAPVRSAAFGVPANQLASCIAYEAAPDMSITVHTLAQRTVLVGKLESVFSTRNVGWELSITGDGARASLAELRAWRTIIGEMPWVDRIWPLVEKCGGLA